MSLNSYVESEQAEENPSPPPAIGVGKNKKSSFLTIENPKIEKVCIITTDGRNLVGVLSAHDHTTNLVRMPLSLPAAALPPRIPSSFSPHLLTGFVFSPLSGPPKHSRAGDPVPRRRRALGRGAAGPVHGARRHRVPGGPGGRAARREHRLDRRQGRGHRDDQALKSSTFLVCSLLGPPALSI